MGPLADHARPGAVHWDSAYQDRGASGLSWYQPYPSVSLDLIHRLGVPRDAAIVDVGGGASTFVDALVAEGFTDLTLLDISAAALDTVRARLSAQAGVGFVHEDLSSWSPPRHFDLWHDRAVFHFLVDEPSRRRYLSTLRRAVAPGGLVVMATFASDGPRSCSGLPVARYSPAALSDAIGPDFVLVEQAREEHVTPAGVVQPFTWVAARRRQRAKSAEVPGSGPPP
jgi:SAM-dependent methyltransferase